MVTKQTKQVSSRTKGFDPKPVPETSISSKEAKHRKQVYTTVKKAITASKRAALEKICESMVSAAAANNGKLPYAYVSTILEESKGTIMSWLTRDILNKSFIRHKAKKEEDHPEKRKEPVQSQIVTRDALKKIKKDDISINEGSKIIFVGKISEQS